ncbi:MAG: bifunctional folylpolyglutamate synthase/dihydrofolate synthase [Flavobacteriales bacterium]
MTYQQVLDFLFNALPMFQRIGGAAYKKDLHNTIALCRALGDPQNKFRSLHVAGTNGKGSSSHMLASVLMEAGYKTGLYTSPHLRDFRERIRINGQMVPEEKVIAFTMARRELFREIEPSFFEMTVGLAFEYFAEEQVDIAIIETGMGGRLDSTNIITPELSLITNIGWDHTAFLGNTLPEIAGEKAGIIKAGVPVVISETQPETEEVFRRKAAEMQADIYFADQLYDISVRSFTADAPRADYLLQDPEAGLQVWESPLTGQYQLQNIRGVYAAVVQLRKKGWQISDEALARGIRKVKSNTGLRGRWEILQQHPLVIADTGHNKNGISYILQQLGTIPRRQLYMVIGMVNDKDVSGILQMLPQDAFYYFTQAAIPRALDAGLLAEQAAAFGLKGRVIPSVPEALADALRQADASDLIFVGGSTFVAAEVL